MHLIAIMMDKKRNLLFVPVTLSPTPIGDPVSVPKEPEYDQVYVPSAQVSNANAPSPSVEEEQACSLEKCVDVKRKNVNLKKGGLGKIKKQKDKLISFLKNQDPLLPGVLNNSRVSSGCSESSGDHFNNVANPRVEISTPILQDTTHVGINSDIVLDTQNSTQEKIDVQPTHQRPKKRALENIKKNIVDKPRVEISSPVLLDTTHVLDMHNSPKESKNVQSSPFPSPKKMEKEASVVQLADAYIEFKLDPAAGDELARLSVSKQNSRPDPPSRPPPSPRLAGPSHKAQSKPSPVIGNQTKCDHLEGYLTPSPQLLPRAPGYLDEKSPSMYDYAVDSDNETNITLYDSSDSSYEDVDAKHKAVSMKLNQTAANKFSPSPPTDYLLPLNKRSLPSSPRDFTDSNALEEHLQVKSDIKSRYANVKSDIGNEVWRERKNLEKQKVAKLKVQTEKQNLTVVSSTKSKGFVLEKLKVKNEEWRTQKSSHVVGSKTGFVKPENSEDQTHSVEHKFGKIESKTGAINSANEQKKSIFKSDNVNFKDYEHIGEQAGGVSDMKKMFEARI
ncbi:uncharacterized protein LOC128236460 [Mya arenaria]|uniref:uncharacterized protein LOC128236460 n=1 Tax=Mya arenaria TaxID=6604 RepID=UPI0022E4EA44|nr:uncharacterized protein LOC128236460 [Mya arenaria]XP_052807284.1 uncharacterized protein LOC128236460 [Mya arenaria]XP_052807285.1 uncharacterized protein LOC128236460 [Mya arenaria]XP_052807286.1 uncharacterized protein LOC128236460 [Mya arenaria]XP_052807287.1 uncharacterized protein LOC128236460 [Mya arenaria]XP_052807288.1 uncharacterized protein LOC128236460 [Mya arenaria]XP_052807290.1 uncharacterized protein LOC128236460 [Mya arenaria]